MFIKGKCEKTTLRLTAMRELTLIAFYFLLSVGEYIAAERRQASETRTVQFTLDDVIFWRDGELLRNSDTKSILTADDVMMHLTNQKLDKKTAWYITRQRILMEKDCAL